MDASEIELLEAVRQLSRGAFRDRAAEFDRAGSFPAQNMDELRALGVPGMTLPAALGGRAIGVEAQTRIMEEIAYGDASTAVALNMHLLVADFLAIFPPFARRDAVLKDIAATGATICAPGSIPTTEVDNRRSGYQFIDDGETLCINGRSGFASGSDGARYTIIGGLIEREGQEPDFVLTLPDLASPGIRVLHNWDAMGLRGTASHDIVAVDLRVPRAEALVVPAPLVRTIREMEARQSTPVSQNRARGAIGILAIWLGPVRHR